MGVYDTIFVPCPKCGEKYDAQTKSGICCLKEYGFKEAKKDDSRFDVNRHAPFMCTKCDTMFFVDVKKWKSVVFKPDKKKIIENFSEGYPIDDIAQSLIGFRFRSFELTSYVESVLRECIKNGKNKRK